MKKILLFFLFTFIFCLTYCLVSTGIETIIINTRIKQFIASSVIEYEKDNIVYHRVSGYTNYQSEKTFDPTIDDIKYVFTSGDIMVNRKGPLKDYSDFINNSFGYFFGGHSAIFDENIKLYEVSGFSAYPAIDSILYPNEGYEVFENNISYVTNYWLSSYTDEWFLLRAKNATTNDINNIVAYAKELYNNGDNNLFNYSFLLNKDKKYYCGDFVARVYNHITPENQSRKFNLNRDGFAVTQNDILLSSDLYLFMYCKVADGIKHLYYI